MKILAFDVHYREDTAKIVCAVFQDWGASKANEYIIKFLSGVADYEPGAFYKRELPCLLEVLKDLDLEEISCIIIDGFVYLDDEGKKGLGAYLYESLTVKVPVVGVAKTSFHNNKLNVIEIKRGESNNPLFVSAIGMEVVDAAERIINMAGAYRMPDLLKEVDTKTKETERK